MNQAHAILVKSNRLLGSQLVEKKLITHQHLEEASERFIDLIHDGQSKQASILSVLLFDLEVLEETDLLHLQIDECGLSPIPLDRLYFEPSEWMDFSAEVAAATRTVPVDRNGDMVTLATAYYLSTPARRYWEDVYSEQMVIWAIAPLVHIEERMLALATAQKPKAPVNPEVAEAQQSS